MEGQETANGNDPVKGKTVVVEEGRGIAMWKDWPEALDRAEILSRCNSRERWVPKFRCRWAAGLGEELR